MEQIVEKTTHENFADLPNDTAIFVTTTNMPVTTDEASCSPFMSLDIFNWEKIELLSAAQLQRLMTWVVLNCDLHRPNVWQIKPIHRSTFLIFFTLFALQICVGVCAHLWMLATITIDYAKDESWQKIIPNQRFYIFNVMMSDLFKLCFVLPVFGAVIFLQNFRFGQTMCYSLTMLQYFPIHVTVFTYLAAARTHNKLAMRPDASPAPTTLLCSLIWIVSVALSIPYSACMEYLELGELLNSDYSGIGICYTNEQAEVPRFLRITFLLLFAAPLLITYRSLSKSAWQIQIQHEIIQADASAQNISPDWEVLTLCRMLRHMPASGCASLPIPEQVRQQLRVQHEMSRTHSCERALRPWRAKLLLHHMWHRSFTTFSLCFVPLYALILAMNWIKETHTSSFTIDIIYLVLVFVAECSACTMPFYYLHFRRQVLRDRVRYEQVDAIRASERAGKVRELYV